jgi:hypothetical protein
MAKASAKTLTAKPGNGSRGASRAKTQCAKIHRAKPGATGGGRFFHIELRPSRDFVGFRVQDVGGPGGVERVAGQRPNGSWDTAKWLVEKSHAHVEDGHLVADSLEAEKVLSSLGSAPVQVSGDRFKAKPRRDIPESEKPTPAMRRAQTENIKKAQAAVRRKRGTKRKATA